MRLLHLLQGYDRESTIMDCIDATPAVWSTLATHLLQVCPVPISIQAVKSMLTERVDLNVVDFQELATSVVDSERLEDASEDARARVLTHLVQGADKDRASVLGSTLALLNQREVLALVRHLVGFDEALDWMYMPRTVRNAAAAKAKHDDGAAAAEVTITATKQDNSPEHAILTCLSDREAQDVTTNAVDGFGAEALYDLLMGTVSMRFADFDDDRQAEVLSILLDQVSPSVKRSLKVGVAPPLPLPKGVAAVKQPILMTSDSDTVDTPRTAADSTPRLEPGARRKVRRRKRFKPLMPLVKYIRKPPRAIVKPKMSTDDTLSLVRCRIALLADL